MRSRRVRRDLAEAVVDTVPEPLLVLDGQLQILSANRAFYREFGGAADDTVGQPFFDVAQHHWDFAALRDLLETVLPRERSFEGRVVDHEFPTLGRRTLRLSARRVLMPADSGELVLLAIEPIDAAAGPAALK